MIALLRAKTLFFVNRQNFCMSVIPFPPARLTAHFPEHCQKKDMHHDSHLETSSNLTLNAAETG